VWALETGLRSEQQASGARRKPLMIQQVTNQKELAQFILLGGDFCPSHNCPFFFAHAS
jgi:hypothetical protein